MTPKHFRYYECVSCGTYQFIKPLKQCRYCRRRDKKFKLHKEEIIR